MHSLIWAFIPWTGVVAGAWHNYNPDLPNSEFVLLAILMLLATPVYAGFVGLCYGSWRIGILTMVLYFGLGFVSIKIIHDYLGSGGPWWSGSPAAPGQDEAWRNAVLQAEAVGMAGRVSLWLTLHLGLRG
jgi:hypothetical protein